MYTASFFADPLLKDGGMTANDAAGRRQADENARQAVDTTVQLGANVMVFWNGRAGFDFVLAKDGRESFNRLVAGFNDVGHYAREKYSSQVRFGIEPKPNEPRANMYLANIGEALYLMDLSLRGLEFQPFGPNPKFRDGFSPSRRVPVT